MLANQEIALLALLVEKNFYGYEMEKTIEYRAMREWTELSISGIYKSLRKLELKKLVSSSREMTDENRIRKTYQITSQGNSELKNEIKGLIRNFQQMKYPVSIAIYNLDQLQPSEAITLLQEYKSELLGKITEYAEVEKCLGDEGCKYFQTAVVSRQLSLFRGELSWLETFLQEIEERK